MAWLGTLGTAASGAAAQGGAGAILGESGRYLTNAATALQKGDLLQGFGNIVAAQNSTGFQNLLNPRTDGTVKGKQKYQQYRGGL